MGFHMNGRKNHQSGNTIWLKCNKWNLKCPYRALFVEKKEAIYAVSFVEHNHLIDETIKENLLKLAKNGWKIV